MIEIKDLVIKLEDATIKYPDFIFENKKVSFIKGKNGTGKSILLKAIADLVDINSGIIVSDSLITYVAQEPFMFDKTVFENIVYPLKIRKLDVDQYLESINLYSEALEIKELLQKNAKNLSSGEKMKVSILRAIIFEPDTILLDEPTSYLDVESIHQLKNIIKKLKSEINFVIVSHNEAFYDELVDNFLALGGNYVCRQNN